MQITVFVLNITSRGDWSVTQTELNFLKKIIEGLMLNFCKNRIFDKVRAILRVMLL